MEEGRGPSEILGRTLIPGVLLTGTIGAGKSTIAESISQVMHDRDLRYALIEFDWLAIVSPPPDPDDRFNSALALQNLSAIWSNLKRAQPHYVVMTATVDSRELLERITAALSDVDFTVCLVTATSKVLAERINQRDHGRLRDDFLARTDQLADVITEIGIADLTVTNEGNREETANEVLSKLGWLAD